MSQGLAITDQDTTISGSLGAMSDTLTIACVGKQSVGFQVVAGGTLSADVTPKVSFDNGVTWKATCFQDIGGTYTAKFTLALSSGDVKAGFFIGCGGATHARLEVTAYSSGSATVSLSATDMAPDALGVSLALQSIGSGSAASQTPVALWSWLGSTNPSIGQKTMANSIPVTIASDQTLERATAGDPVAIQVDTTAVQLLASNANAKSRIITNNYYTYIYLGRANTVTATGATMGIILLPGGSYTDSGADLYTGPIYAIGSAAIGFENVSVWERT